MPKTKPTQDASPFVPSERSLQTMREAAAECRGCELYKNATQTVFGEGPRNASIMLVGEQPGDVEDRTGHPFVGPAGKVLLEAMDAAGLARSDVYITNAVKHFKWEPRGKRRMHQKPAYAEVVACRPWLNAEIESVTPQVIVCLGATAGQSFFGSAFRLARSFGQELTDSSGRRILTTYHPSAILRMETEEEKAAGREALVDALKRAKAMVSRSPR